MKPKVKGRFVVVFLGLGLLIIPSISQSADKETIRASGASLEHLNPDPQSSESLRLRALIPLYEKLLDARILVAANEYHAAEALKKYEETELKRAENLGADKELSYQAVEGHRYRMQAAALDVQIKQNRYVELKNAKDLIMARLSMGLDAPVY